MSHRLLTRYHGSYRRCINVFIYRTYEVVLFTLVPSININSTSYSYSSYTLIYSSRTTGWYADTSQGTSFTSEFLRSHTHSEILTVYMFGCKTYAYRSAFCCSSLCPLSWKPSTFARYIRPRGGRGIPSPRVISYGRSHPFRYTQTRRLILRVVYIACDTVCISHCFR